MSLRPRNDFWVNVFSIDFHWKDIILLKVEGLTMNSEIYHNTKTIPLAERETFNNTIILLTLIKSQYYYIVGFSRPSNIIEIAFDYESELHSAITESITVDFGSDDECVVMHAVLNNVFAQNFSLSENFVTEGVFSCDGDKVVYDFKVKKDKLIPTSIEKMNGYILQAKSEIVAFLEGCYEMHLA